MSEELFMPYSKHRSTLIHSFQVLVGLFLIYKTKIFNSLFSDFEHKNLSFFCNSKHDTLEYEEIKFMTVTSDVCEKVYF